MEPLSSVNYLRCIVLFNMNRDIAVCTVQTLPKIGLATVVVNRDVHYRRIRWHGFKSYFQAAGPWIQKVLVRRVLVAVLGLGDPSSFSENQ